MYVYRYQDLLLLTACAYEVLLLVIWSVVAVCCSVLQCADIKCCCSCTPFIPLNFVWRTWYLCDENRRDWALKGSRYKCEWVTNSTYKRVTIYIWMRHKLYTCMSHVTHMNESRTPHTKESRSTYEWVKNSTYTWFMSHTWMSKTTHMNESQTSDINQSRAVYLMYLRSGRWEPIRLDSCFTSYVEFVAKVCVEFVTHWYLRSGRWEPMKLGKGSHFTCKWVTNSKYKKITTYI